MKTLNITYIPAPIIAIIAIIICLTFQNCEKKQQPSIQNLLTELRSNLDPNDSSQTSLIHKIDSLQNTDNPDISPAIYDYNMHLHYTGQQAKAVEFYSSLAYYYQLLQSPSKKDYENLINCYIPLGAAFEELGLKNMAMDYYMRGIEIAQDQHLDQHRAMLLNNIGVIYYGVNDYDRALSYFTQASEINHRYNRNHQLFLNYNNLADVYLKKNDLTKSMDYSLKALQYLSENDEPTLYYMMHVNIGNIYALRKDYPMALSYINNAIIHQRRQGSTSYLIDSYIAISDVYNKMNRPDSANYFADEAHRLALLTDNISLQNYALLSKSKLQYQQGNYAQAFTLHQNADILKDSIQKIDNRKKMEEWEKIYQIEKIHTLNQSAISSWNPETIFYVMGGIVITLILLIIVIYMLKHTNEKKFKAKEQADSARTKKQSEQIAAGEVKSKEMQEKIDQRNRQLTAYTLEKLRLSECITDINTELRQVLLDLNPRSKEHKDRIQNLLRKLLQLESRNDWEEFQYYFEKVHPSFYLKLDAINPSLTTKDKRLCAFILLGLTTKEIASITFREVRSCESSRHRLRKKLSVPSDVGLTDFIRQITR